LGCIAYGQGAIARDTDTATVSVKASYADLNLSSEAGARVMLQRIRHAAQTICGFRPDAPMDYQTQYTPCVERTTNRAVAQLDNPIVMALNRGRHPPAAVVTASTP
jgi:UrcA family protein